MVRNTLKENHFHVLLALSASALHGFGIQRAILDQTSGRLKLWPASLYGCLEDLHGRGWIEELTDDDRPAVSERRRYYRITAAGKARLNRETDRLAALVDLARKRLTASSSVD